MTRITETGQDWFEQMAAKCIERGAPAGWRVSISSLLGTYPNHTHYQFVGAIYEPFVRGPKAGRPNYRKPVDGTEMTFVLSNAEVRGAP